MKRTYVSRAAMLAHLADGWQMADPPEVVERDGETLFLVVKPAPAWQSALGSLFRAAATAWRGATA